MVQKYQKHTDQEWMKLINECRTSGLSDKAWCMNNSIPSSTFYKVVSRFQKRACSILAVQKHPFNETQMVVPVRVMGEQTSCTPYDSHDSVQECPAAVTIIINGYSVRISNSAAKETIINTLSALHQVC